MQISLLKIKKDTVMTELDITAAIESQKINQEYKCVKKLKHVAVNIAVLDFNKSKNLIK